MTTTYALDPVDDCPQCRRLGDALERDAKLRTVRHSERMSGQWLPSTTRRMRRLLTAADHAHLALSGGSAKVTTTLEAPASAGVENDARDGRSGDAATTLTQNAGPAPEKG